MLDRHVQHIRGNFPDLPRRALQFFDMSNAATGPNGMPGRTAMEFATSVQIPNPAFESTHLMPAFHVLRAILNRMVDVGVLMRQGIDGDFINTRYLYLKGDEQWLDIIDFVVYGFPSIIDAHDKSILQIIAHSEGDQASGTCFVASANGLLTAAHCVANAQKIEIAGLKKADLIGARIFLARSPTTDCAFIGLPNPLLSDRRVPHWGDANILEDVVLLGYPNIPTLLSVRIAEKANVSTILRGAVASKAGDIFGSELLLITAQVRGGFSGGPVINNSGVTVGMISRQPFPQLEQSEIQRYDAAGFGLAIPRSVLARFMDAINNNDTSIVEERDQSSFKWVDGS
jgi:serine protease Do